jgi:dTDP-4-dehydrorhamnose reductase
MSQVNARQHLLNIWGGIEPTIVRVGDSWRSQVHETGHDGRLEDLDRIASLGIRTLRYPVIWESIAPENLQDRDWSWHDVRLNRLRELGIHVVAGLVHHGSGPRYTNLLDPEFPEKLAVFAESVAARYPWLTSFTPVNEPLTTARFSALYGHWYPHHADYASCLRALVTQCRGVVLAMRAIRRVTPEAMLVQTEDFGRTFSTPLLRYQADFDNERRWLTFDLLCGRVNQSHPLRGFLLEHGVTKADLAFFLDQVEPPGILGMNHYLTSDRYLDERMEHYPEHHHGGNGQHQYADVEAVRVELPPGTLGVAPRLEEIWNRYGLPVAVTEVHHGSTRDEQLRWLVECWSTVNRLLQKGVDVRGFTVWALFGLMDWRSLLLRHDRFYEPGPFDARCDPPQPTVLAAATAAMARGEEFQHPVLQSPGWWHREGRHYTCPPFPRPADDAQRQSPILIAGGDGRLAGVLARFCAERGIAVVAPGRSRLAIADPAAVQDAIVQHRPWAVIDAAELGQDDGFWDTDRARAELQGTAALADLCAERGLPLVAFSTAEVFSGEPGRIYCEDDAVSPCSSFGEYKARAEERLLAAHPAALVLRHGHLVEPGAPPPPALAPAALTHVPDLATAVLDLLVDGRVGLWHLTHPEDEAAAHHRGVRLASHRGRIMPYPGEWWHRLVEDSLTRAPT